MLAGPPPLWCRGAVPPRTLQLPNPPSRSRLQRSQGSCKHEQPIVEQLLVNTAATFCYNACLFALEHNLPGRIWLLVRRFLGNHDLFTVNLLTDLVYLRIQRRKGRHSHRPQEGLPGKAAGRYGHQAES